MNEKKIRRDIRVCKATEWFLAIVMLVCVGFAFYFDSVSVNNNPFDQWKFERWILSLFSAGLAVGCSVLSLGCLVIRRNAEYVLFLKETGQGQSKPPVEVAR